MRTVALISGGKDSCYNMMQCVAEGHEIVVLANLRPDKQDELDSYMYQTVGHHAIDLYSQAIGLPLIRRTIEGQSKVITRDYTPTNDDEVEDLYQLLSEVKEKFAVEAVSVGAILSDYQRVRVENVCQRLGLTSLGYLWRRNQSQLLQEMIACGIDAILIKVASLGLSPKKHLGKSLKELQSELMEMHQEYDLNVCGEGGEYETFTLDCPLFQQKIVLDQTKTVIHSDDPFAPVGYLNLEKAHLEEKDIDTSLSMIDRLKILPMKRSSDLDNEKCSDEFAPCLDFHSSEKVHYSCKTETLSSKVYPKIKQHGVDVWISGVIGKYTSSDSLQDITRSAMENIKDMLSSLGEHWSMSNLVYVHLYVQNMADFADINSIYKTYFSINPPARVCVQTLLPKDVALQIDCYGNCSHSKQTMHVQGISHWAPANIGPYSQCVKVNTRMYVAGQIPLIPGAMKIHQKGMIAEAKLSLQHVARILDAMHHGCNITHVECVVCYLTHPEYLEVARFEWQKFLSNYYKTYHDLLSASPHPVYVVVPSLPRDASVEWQVCATTHGLNKVDREGYDFSFAQYPASITVGDMTNPHVLVTTKSLHWFYKDELTHTEEERTKLVLPKLYVHYNCALDSLSTREIAKSLCDCIKEALASISGKTCLPLLRIFYRAADLDYNDLYQDLEQSFADWKIEVIFSLVPVHTLGTKNLIIEVTS